MILYSLCEFDDVIFRYFLSMKVMKSRPLSKSCEWPCDASGCHWTACSSLLLVFGWFGGLKQPSNHSRSVFSYLLPHCLMLAACLAQEESPYSCRFFWSPISQDRLAANWLMKVSCGAISVDTSECSPAPTPLGSCGCPIPLGIADHRTHS